MINPNMVNMNKVPDIPPQSELWKNEKEKYRHWIILFGVAILAIFALYLSSFIWNLVDSVVIKEKMTNIAKQYDANRGVNLPDAYYDDEISRWFQTNIIVFPSILLAFISLAFFFYFFSVARSYQSKTFAKLSGIPTFFTGISAFLAFYQLFSLIWRTSFEFDFSGGIYLFISYILLIVVAIVLSSPIGRIRRTFILSARIEAIKNDPTFQSMQQQFGNSMASDNVDISPEMSSSSVFNPFMGAVPTNLKKNGQQGSERAGAEQKMSPQDLKRLELEKMSLEDLKKIADRLSISGFTSMEKRELIDNILRVTSA